MRGGRAECAIGTRRSLKGGRPKLLPPAMQWGHFARVGLASLQDGQAGFRRHLTERVSRCLEFVSQSQRDAHRTRGTPTIASDGHSSPVGCRCAPPGCLPAKQEAGGHHLRGGLGEQRFRRTTDELAELTEEINETSAMLENAGVDNGIGEISEEELLLELDALEDVDDLADALASTGIEDGGNDAEGAVKKETKEDSEMVETGVEKEAVGEVEGDCTGRGMEKEAVAS